MSNIEKYPKCHMRTSLGNCDPIGGFCTSVTTTICEALHKVAEPKIGEWIYLYGSIGSYMTMSCSFCGETFNDVAEWKYNYCPNCGARMRGDKDDKR